MKKETLEKAKAIEDDIRSIEKAMEIHKDTRHFEFVEHYGPDARSIKMPRSMNNKLLAVLAEERERLEHELEMLSDNMPMEQGDWQPMYTYVEGERVVEDGIEYEYRKGKFVPVHKRSWLERIYGIYPYVIITLDAAVMSWVCFRYWEIVSQFFAGLLILNVGIVLGLTVPVMLEMDTYIRGLWKHKSVTRRNSLRRINN